MSNCPICENHAREWRHDIYKDQRPFLYCDICGALADEKTVKYITALERSNKELREALEKAVRAIEAEQRIIPSVKFAEVLPVARAALSAANKGDNHG